VASHRKNMNSVMIPQRSTMVSNVLSPESSFGSLKMRGTKKLNAYIASKG
jgi:hypothetical protein